MSTTSSLVERRDRAMDRADRALDAHWPDRQGPDYEREMQAVASDLESVAAEMRTARSDRVEQSRTHRFLGSVYSDLSPALGHAMLERARDAYLEAERLLAGHGDALEQAKLDFNLGNTLRQLDANDAEQLSEARRRFVSARAVFQDQEPRFLAQVSEAMRSVDALLKIAPVATAVNRNLEDMKAAQEEMASGRSVAAAAEKARQIMSRDGGPAGMIGRIQGVLAQLPAEFKKDERLEEIQRKLTGVTEQAIHTGLRDPEAATILEALKKRLADDEKSGKVASGRAGALGRLIAQIGGALSGGDDIDSLISTVQELRRGAEDEFEILHYLSHGIPRPPSGSRASELVELCWRLRRFLIEAMNRSGKGQLESRSALDLNVRAAEVDRRIYEAGADDDEALRVEQEELRPFALAVRRVALAPHSMIAHPIWPAAKTSADSSTVFYSGSQSVRKILARLAKRRGLLLQRRPRGEGFANARWKQLQSAATSVFELSGSDGPNRAAVAYELGIALTLGKPIVIVSDSDDLPFDIDVEPVVLTGAAESQEELADVLDESLVWTPARGRSEALAETLDHVVAAYPRPGANATIDQTLRGLEELRDELDPVAVTHTLRTLVDFLDEPGASVIQPIWTPAYPDPQCKRLFHVMPFRPKWAPKASDTARAACDAVGAEYIRGDEVDDPDVIRSIWEGINRASHVLVDLTGFNSNVALEAGIAHTLGRPTMLTGKKTGIMDKLFPNIAKLRIYPYRDAAGPGIGDALGEFLA